MKVQECSQNNNVALNTSARKNPNFKSGLLNLAGGTMQAIQNGGFLTSFLIQDGLGMTTPRVITGFLRDKEVTGKINTQEGFEVLGREGLTGPLMMSMAPLMLFFAAKFGKSTSVNSQLIKRFGNSLKELIAKPEFNRGLLKDKQKFQSEYFKSNMEKILKDSLGEGNYSKKDLKYILDEINKYLNIPAESNKFRKRGQYKNEHMQNIINKINDLRYSTSSNLHSLERVKVDGKEFGIKEAIDGMVKYSDDILKLGDNLAILDENAAEALKNRSIGKRIVTNVGTLLATLGVMSVLPKIYARNDIAPGARTAMELKEMERLALEESNSENNEVSFKAAAPKASLLERIGKKFTEKVPEKWSSELEYNGHNFTNTLMVGLSGFGLLVPRGARAVARAQKDEDGKKDLTELYEILLRDVTSTLSVIFAVPMLTRALVSSYENRSGFVLLEKDRTRTGLKARLDLLNPYSGSHVLTNKEINAIYDGANSKAKMLNFCDFIDKNGGDLKKILSKTDTGKEIFSDVKLEDLKNLSKHESNLKIREVIANLGKNADEAIINLMQSYSVIDTKDKLVRFCDYINQSGGDLYKILSKADKNNQIIKDLNLKELAKLSPEKRNANIREVVSNLGENSDEIVKKLMQSVEKKKPAKIFSTARGLNSIPALITTFFISPFILGWFIPRLTYANTRRIHAKKEEEQKAKLNTVS